MPELSLRMSLAAAAILIATSGLAAAQAITKYDGTYNGVSNTTNGDGKMCVTAIPIPRPLTIRNGTAQWAAGISADIIFQGNVTADGGLHAQGSNGVTYVGRIDGSGKITLGNSNPGGGSCTHTSVWQKS